LTYEQHLDDELGEIWDLLGRAIDSLPTKYRVAVRESLRASEACDPSSIIHPVLSPTQRTTLYRARRMLAEDPSLSSFFERKNRDT
jgi:hypothetical protein